MIERQPPARAMPEAPDTDGLAERLRDLRRDRGLSLAQIAAATGISRSFLSMLEAGKTDVSMRRLMALVRFYGVSLTELVPGEPAASSPIVVRSTERRRLHSPGEGWDVYLLAPDTNRRMLPVLGVYEPGGGSSEHFSHEGEEFAFVLEGALELTIAEETPLLLEEGDSVYFLADRPHQYRNASDNKTVYFGVVTPSHL